MVVKKKKEPGKKLKDEPTKTVKLEKKRKNRRRTDKKQLSLRKRKIEDR